MNEQEIICGAKKSETQFPIHACDSQQGSIRVKTLMGHKGLFSSDDAFAGLALRLLASFLLATMTALVKLAEQRGATLSETMFFRQACAVPLVVVWLVAGPGLRSIATARPGAHVVRTLIGLFGMITTFGAVLMLPLAEMTTLQFTVPIFATILGSLILKEATGWHRGSAICVGFIGVMIMAQPGSSHFPLAGVAVGLTSAFLVAVIAILLRQIGRTENASTTVFWFSILSLPPLGLAYLFNLHRHDWLTWAVLIGIGLIGGAAQLALTSSVRIAPVSTVIAMDYSSLIWGTLYGWLLFGSFPQPATWIGAPIIISSGLYIGYREHRLRTVQTEDGVGTR